MAKVKPSLVFVHGGWHDPTCFDRVRQPLESAGYTCHTPALPSIGDLAASKTAQDDVDLIHGIVAGCLARNEDVIVIGHSNGGLKACGALQGLVDESGGKTEGGRVLGIGMIAAFIPPAFGKGKGAFKDVPAPGTSWWVFNDKEPTFLPDDPKRLFYNDMSDEDAEYWASRIRPMHISSPMEFYEAWRYIPISYLFCDDDAVQLPQLQDSMIKAAKAEGGIVHVHHVQAGHSPFLSKPNETVKWIERAAEVDFSAA